jgi:plasmid stabilization system protein ParE
MIRYEAAALTELTDAAAYLERERPTLAARFMAAVTDAEVRIVEFPEAWPRYEDDTRRCPVLGFPYWLVYMRDGDFMNILGVVHGRREPGYWRGRR